MTEKYVSLNEWLDSHEVSIDELGTDKVADACREALKDILLDDAISELISNEKEEVVDTLYDVLQGEFPDELIRAIEGIVKKHNEDWRILISDNFDPEQGYDDFFEAHRDEFVAWLKQHGKKVFDDPDELEDYYLGEGIDDFLEFAYWLLGDKDMFDPNCGCLLNNIDVDEFMDTFEDEIREYLSGNMDNYEDEEWFRNWVRDYFEDELWNYITPDDYYPIWNYAWEFPTRYDAKDLNEMMNGTGLVFFELDYTVYVSLATAGMSMMPALYYAYYEYSDVYVDPEEIARGIVSNGVGYWKHVIGERRLLRLVEDIGYSLKELDRISKEDMKQFNQLLDSLSEEVKKKNLDRTEAYLLGMMKLLEKPDVSRAKTSS